MTDLEELRRWCRYAGHYAAAEIVERWMLMPEYDKASLRRRWALEDEQRRQKMQEEIERHGTG